MPVQGSLGASQVKAIRMIVQQPQFLPWAGLWFKAVSADVYVIYAGVKFDQYDHQHRVQIDRAWVTLPVERGQRHRLIKDVLLAENYQTALGRIGKTIRMSCMGKRFPYRDRLDGIVSILEGWNGRWMLDLNNALMFSLAEVLGIRTRFFVDLIERPMERIDKLDSCIERYSLGQPVMYLAGRGGLDYMSHTSLKIPVETRFQLMREGISPDSILQSISKEKNPLAAVRSCARWETKEGLLYEWDNETRADPGPALR